MLDYDVVIIGAGPAGLSAGIYLTRAKYNTLVIEKENLGGQITKVETIENYPGFSKGVSGPELASEMLAQAVNFGLQIDLGEINGIEIYSQSKCLQLTDGRSITAKAIIIACGCNRMKLGVPGEMDYEGRGVFGCALCDGGQFAGKKVAVCGGGDSGITEAIYMSKLASDVVLLEARESLTASPILQDRARDIPNLQILCGTKVTSISGNAEVEAVETENTGTKEKRTLQVDGILVDIGMKPNTGFLNDVVPLDPSGHILVNEKMETSVPYIYAAGDIRSGSMAQVITGANDGAVAAMALQKRLQQDV